jgi:hypothetical protein
MLDTHAWNLLALHVPNLLPRSVPWIQIHHWHIKFQHSIWVRHAGRLIWASIIFFILLIGAIVVVRKPKKTNEPATWAQSIAGAFYVWMMMTLIFGVMPSEWIIFGNSYLNFDSSTYVLKGTRSTGGWVPFNITRADVVDLIATTFYIVGIVLFVALAVAWQKRKVAEPASESEVVEPSEPSGGPLSRLRARREKRVSAYGRPVTTSDS